MTKAERVRQLAEELAQECGMPVEHLIKLWMNATYGKPFVEEDDQ